MSELPSSSESLVEDDSESFEFDGATAPESFMIKTPNAVGAKLSTENSKRALWINVYIPLGLLAAAALVVLILGKVEPASRPPIDTSRVGRLRALPSVRVQQVRSLEATGAQLQLRADGTVVPYREAQIAAEVAGRIVQKADICEAGSYVKKGQLLMEIDPTDYELEVQRLTRMREQEYQALQEIDQEMVNMNRLIAVAKQEVEIQQKEVDRQKALPPGFASRAEVDQAQRSLLQAQQQQLTSQNQLDLLLKRRVRLEASERLAATQLKVAEINLERTKIVAPIDGVSVSEDAEMNTFVARGNTLVTIEDTSRVEVATSLRMDQLYWVLDQQHQRRDELSRGYDLPETPAIIEYELSGREGVSYRWQGRLLRYDGIGLDPNTRTVPVRVVVDNPRQYVDETGEIKDSVGPTALVRGMYVQVKLLIKPQTPLVVIPAEALKP
ncbi:MAG: biotin/lipoyl-binding protein, partial [Pirellulales bacterium]|nr:biotin/lipoyl-binding protein [Pirellulales bacterium]